MLEERLVGRDSYEELVETEGQRYLTMLKERCREFYGGKGMKTEAKYGYSC